MGQGAKMAPEENFNDLYEKTRSEGFGDEVKRRLLIGAFVLSAGFYDKILFKSSKGKSL